MAFHFLCRCTYPARAGIRRVTAAPAISSFRVFPNPSTITPSPSTTTGLLLPRTTTNSTGSSVLQCVREGHPMNTSSVEAGKVRSFAILPTTGVSSLLGGGPPTTGCVLQAAGGDPSSQNVLSLGTSGDVCYGGSGIGATCEKAAPTYVEDATTKGINILLVISNYCRTSSTCSLYYGGDRLLLLCQERCEGHGGRSLP